jgi:transcriptional regulator with XRE-family HTH domain
VLHSARSWEVRAVPGTIPTVRRRRLAIELRRLREASGLTIDQVAQILECSDSKISRIETGQVSATPRDVRDILAIYGVDDQQRDELVQTAREARQKGWWHEFSDVGPRPGIAFEAEVHSMSIYAALVIPGLLQVPDYARAVLRAIRHALPAEEIDRLMELRMARQALLTQADPPSLWVVLDEGALRRGIGGPEVMRAQLARLTEVGALPNVTLQMLPLTAGAHAGLDGPFMLMGFPEAVDPNVVYIEMTTSDLWLEDPATVREYDLLFDHLRAAALPPDESLEFFAKVAKEV